MVCSPNVMKYQPKILKETLGIIACSMAVSSCFPWPLPHMCPKLPLPLLSPHGGNVPPSAATPLTLRASIAAHGRYSRFPCCILLFVGRLSLSIILVCNILHGFKTKEQHMEATKEYVFFVWMQLCLDRDHAHSDFHRSHAFIHWSWNTSVI